MESSTTIKKLFISTLTVAVVSLAFASMGGGGDKKKNSSIPLKTNFVPIRTTSGFTLKAGPAFSGSYVLGTERSRNSLFFNTVITYQKGNSIYIMPYKYKISNSFYMNTNGNNNLQLLDLRIKMHK